MNQPRPQWEYKSIKFPLAFKSIGTKDLDEAGLEGSELVAMIPLQNAAVAMLKRVRSPQS